MICLCLYDGFLTMLDLHHSALLADLAVSHDARAQLNSYCSIFSAFGSLSVFMSYMVWDRDSLLTFQVSEFYDGPGMKLFFHTHLHTFYHTLIYCTVTYSQTGLLYITTHFPCVSLKFSNGPNVKLYAFLLLKNTHKHSLPFLMCVKSVAFSHLSSSYRHT